MLGTTYDPHSYLLMKTCSESGTVATTLFTLMAKDGVNTWEFKVYQIRALQGTYTRGSRLHSNFCLL